MVFRRRPLLRAAAVGGGAYLAGKHVGREQGTSDPERQQAASAPAAAGTQAAEPSVAEQLNRLAELHDQGVLSDGEFAAAKGKLLGT